MWNSLPLEKHVARRYIPSSTKWKLVLRGLGKLYGAIGNELEKGEGAGDRTKALADAAYRVGLDFGEDLKEEFKLGSSIEDVAVAMDLEHRVFGMKAKVAEKSDRRIVYHCSECAWKKYFTPKLCIAIGQAEKGIAHALNPKAQYHILQTRTMGKDRCIFEVEI
jgi:predicted hydrocarbon binding protein